MTNVKHNLDSTITLTVDAVCEMVLCNEAVITHELTVKFAKDGSFKYLGNKILNNGIERYPPINTVFVKDDVVRRADSAIKGVL
ncbi:MAG: DUF6070 family protein [Eubacterium sp.]|uniref:DUF6070 family protein n=1 Tax=Eubacterium sp. TaxID=142586 RepID=UPI00399AEBED